MASEEQSDCWRVIFAEELRKWQAKSYDELREALLDVIEGKDCCVNYVREGPGGPYCIEVVPLESLPEYFHVMVDVSAYGQEHSIAYDFIRHADGRLDGKDI